MCNSSHNKEAIVDKTSYGPLNAMVSQLSFTTEVPRDASLNRSFEVWNGLLCFCSDDLFYDAAQDVARKNDEDDTPPDGELTSDSSQDSIREPTIVVKGPFAPLSPPKPPTKLPLRFLKAGKDDLIEGQRRYEATLKWRKKEGMDKILAEPHPNFDIIKKSYPHYWHGRGRDGKLVFYEQPAKTDLKAMLDEGVTMNGLLRHYAMITEFGWQFLERNDHGRSITVIDLEGIRISDFVGDCVKYVKQCSHFTGEHYPERAGFIFVINVPMWFNMIWKVVKPWVDEVTLKKIEIIRGKKHALEALRKKIPIENIPKEYGGKSVSLGQSEEEMLLKNLMKHNQKRAAGDISCGGRSASPPCQYCGFLPARSY